jgi:hypothetical protein
VAGAWLDYVLRKGWPLLTPTNSSGPAIILTDSASVI